MDFNVMRKNASILGYLQYKIKILWIFSLKKNLKKFSIVQTFLKVVKYCVFSLNFVLLLSVH